MKKHAGKLLNQKSLIAFVFAFALTQGGLLAGDNTVNGQINWHYHPGYEIFIVKTGAVTEYPDQPGCPKNVYPAGSVFFSGESHVHKIVNETEGTTEFFPTFIVPPDSPTIYFVTPKYCGQ